MSIVHAFYHLARQRELALSYLNRAHAALNRGDAQSARDWVLEAIQKLITDEDASSAAEKPSTEGVR
jgi:hypothetical protein